MNIKLIVSSEASSGSAIEKDAAEEAAEGMIAIRECSGNSN